MITFVVLGTPRPQGSLKLFKAKSGKTIAQHSSTTLEWRGLVTAQVRAQMRSSEMLTGPLSVSMIFDMARPKGHYGTGKNADKLKDSAPNLYHAQMPDLDKLARSVNDSLTDAGVWEDDGQVAVMNVAKRWCTNGDVPGVEIVIEAL